ncbi:MAG: hypothetical protein INR69_22950 [Mucilaginibacter polytrichastri]|nr:hypothetical protein [Mucilaginibacter polytrichastri]
MRTFAAKYALLLLLMFFCIDASAQETPVKKIGKISIGKRKTYTFNRDSVVNLSIDTLIMEDKSTLEFLSAKTASITIGHAIIGKQCIITGTDGKNNGTRFNIKADFDKLESLFIVSRGQDYYSRPAFGNGNGGDVKLKYASGGAKVQTTDKKSPGYLSIVNTGGGKAVTPQSDLYVIRSRIAMGSGNIGRPLTNLPQGRVYDGSMGTDGKTSIEKY